MVNSVNECVWQQQVYLIKVQKKINCAQLRLIDALHPSYFDYQVILKAGE